MNIGRILDTLPHRYPFLLVDKVLEIDEEKGRVVAQKNVSFNEPFFNGHFPGSPIMPGVLILEALAQAGALAMHNDLDPGSLALLLSIEKAKFRKAVVPGDVLILEVIAKHVNKRGGKVSAKAFVDDSLAVEAEIAYVVVDRKQLRN